MCIRLRQRPIEHRAVKRQPVLRRVELRPHPEHLLVAARPTQRGREAEHDPARPDAAQRLALDHVGSGGEVALDEEPPQPHRQPGRVHQHGEQPPLVPEGYQGVGEAQVGIPHRELDRAA
jgi:hypothetical protein